MPLIPRLSIDERKKVLDRTLKAFIVWCNQEFGVDLYDYEIRISYWCLYALLVEPIDVAIKIARQSGKTETITLLVRFLIIFFRLLTGTPLRCGMASPKGEQAKTSLDRIKLSVAKMRDRWHVEDREFNAATVRAFRFEQLYAEIFRFSLAPTTSNESKTLNLLIVDEAHLADDMKRSNELDPMLASTNGVTFFIGVGCTRLCDFKRMTDGETANSKAIVVPVDEVIRDRRKKFEVTGDPKHLQYEHAFERELRKKGRQNPEIKRNYYLEDMIEEGNFISRERFLSLARGKPCCADQFYVGIDWARTSDWTWAAVVNAENDLVNVWKYPHVPYEEQIGMILQDLEPYRLGIQGVRCDATSANMQSEYLMGKGLLPMGEESLYAFTQKSKNDLYTTFEGALFRDPGDPLRFSYPAWHPLASEVEEQMTQLIREYKGDGEFLSPHAPEVPGAHDDAPTAIALAVMAASVGGIGDLLIL